ncbi:MAG TPA: GYD domain-containing protein [Lacipirellulaceae bacterium]|nr:GYD domain-containing protein [Lacipirellulaceae bacterium]
MATFIATLKFTAKGVQNLRESPKRATAFTAAAKKLGVKVIDLYWTLGPFDGVILFDAPDDDTATAAMLSLAGQGNVQTTTARAFDRTEIEKVIGMFPKR